MTGLFALLFALPLAAATVDVQVTYPDGSAIRDAVVYAIPARHMTVGHKVATMDQRDRTFVPHVLPIQAGTWVEFPNSDNIRHQVYSQSPAKRFQLPLYSGKPAFPLQFATPGVITLGCNIHEQMSAYIVVVDTPYFAKTEAGPAVLRELDGGQYTLRVWYPGMREEPKSQTVTL
ncbi:MAG TPA: methylamine utilization protein, partial [Thermoanaerobaculia bacterium]|nr:methylamine utilization protein [Thermoanaerobaculia bacterium]